MIIGKREFVDFGVNVYVGGALPWGKICKVKVCLHYSAKSYSTCQYINDNVFSVKHKAVTSFIAKAFKIYNQLIKYVIKDLF